MQKTKQARLIGMLTPILGDVFAIAWLDAEGRVFQVNQRFLWLMGVEEHQTIGKRCPLMSMSPDGASTRQAGGFWRGQFRNSDVILVPIPALECYLVLAQPSQHVADVEAEADHLLSRMARRLSHEIGTRIASACMAADVLASRLGDRPAERTLISDMRSRLVSATGLLDEVRSYAKPRLLQFDDAVNVARIVENLFAGSPHIAWEAPPVPCTVRADPAALKSLLLRLVRNAEEATDDRQLAVHIALGIDLTGSWVSISVSDAGPGIPAETVPKVFEPFFTTKNCNLGLGLTVARRTAEAHGGTLLLRSGNPRGTVAEVLLPRTYSGKVANVRESQPGDAQPG